MERTNDLLIIGAGPTGLAAACEARRQGLEVRVVERRASRAELSKALVVHARTMEVLEVMGCADAVLAAGQRFKALNVRVASGATPIRVDLLDRAWGDTRFPFWLSVPQYEVERILERRFLELGGQIDWATSLEDLTTDADGVSATLVGADGARTAHRSRFLLACDGSRSDAREKSGLRLERQGLGVTFALADVWTRCDLIEDEGHVVLSRDGVLLVVPMPEPRLWRLIAQVGPGFDPASADAWSTLVKERLRVDLGIDRLGWNSRFDLTGGVADRFRKGRVFLLGDAAHVHSPVGGQGLNTGVQDANNLVWKLALVLRGEVSGDAAEALLDSYERERQPIARQMVKTTTFATRVLTLRNPVVRAVRGLLARVVLRARPFINRLGRGVGMLDIRNDGSARLANPELPGGARLYDRLDAVRPTLLRWQGREVLVRPDRIVAREGLLPARLAVPLEVS